MGVAGESVIGVHVRVSPSAVYQSDIHHFTRKSLRVCLSGAVAESLIAAYRPALSEQKDMRIVTIG